MKPAEWRGMAWHDQQALTEGLMNDLERRRAAAEEAGGVGDKQTFDLSSLAGMADMGVTVQGA